MKIINNLTSPLLAFVLVTGACRTRQQPKVDPAKALAALQEKVLSKGPNGEEPSPASSVSLTAEEIAKDPRTQSQSSDRDALYAK